MLFIILYLKKGSYEIKLSNVCLSLFHFFYFFIYMCAIYKISNILSKNGLINNKKRDRRDPLLGFTVMVNILKSRYLLSVLLLFPSSFLIRI